MWIIEKLNEIQKGEMKDAAPPEFGAAEDSENVIGEVPMELRKFSHYLNDQLKEIKSMIDQANRIDSKKEAEAIATKARRMSRDYETMRQIFWIEIRKAMGVETSCLGIRQGWLIVRTCEDKERCGHA